MIKHWHRVFKTSLITAFCVLFSGCASILSTSNYSIEIKSSPKDANITVTNQKGAVFYSGATPASMVLPAHAGFFQKAIYKVDFTKEGFDDIQPEIISARLDAMYMGNLLFGGLLGMLIIDPATGAMWKLDEKVIRKSLFDPAQNDYNLFFDYKRLTLNFLGGTTFYKTGLHFAFNEYITIGIMIPIDSSIKTEYTETQDTYELHVFEERVFTPAYFISPNIRLNNLSIYLHAGLQREPIRTTRYYQVGFFPIDSDSRVKNHLFLEPGLRYSLFDWMSVELNIPVSPIFGINGGVAFHPF